MVRLAFAILVWNELRPWVLLLGVMLHLGIEYAVRVGFFSFAALVAYVATSARDRQRLGLSAPGSTGQEPARLAGAERRASRASRARRPVMSEAILLYDADCGFCRWAIDKLLAWDRAGRLRPAALQGRRPTVSCMG